MKKIIAISLVALSMLMLAACGTKAATVSAAVETKPTQETVQVQATVPVPETQATEATAPAVTEAPKPEYPGVYMRTIREEIGGTVTERHSYIVLNEDHTGYSILQDIGALTWNEGQMTEAIGLSYNIALAQENSTVNLLVYEFQDANPTVYEKIEKLPADMEQLVAEFSANP